MTAAAVLHQMQRQQSHTAVFSLLPNLQLPLLLDPHHTTMFKASDQTKCMHCPQTHMVVCACVTVIGRKQAYVCIPVVTSLNHTTHRWMFYTRAGPSERLMQRPIERQQQVSAPTIHQCHIPCKSVSPFTLIHNNYSIVPTYPSM